MAAAVFSRAPPHVAPEVQRGAAACGDREPVAPVAATPALVAWRVLGGDAEVYIMSRWSPLGALCGGVVAGFVGSLAQNLYFAWTRQLAPQPAPAAFEPLEPEQREELPTQTVARRLKQHLALRGPVQHQGRAAQAVHLAFGSAWGALYGLLAGSLPRSSSLRGGLAFGALVWVSSDNVLLPAFRLAAWPHHYPVKTHLYAIGAHAVYGAAVAGTFEGLRRASLPATALLGSLWLTRGTPRFLRPRARRLAARSLRVALPLRDALRALA